jgi:hypothetical protein
MLRIEPKLEVVAMRQIRKALLSQLRDHRRKVRLRLKDNANRLCIRKDIATFGTLIPIIQAFAIDGQKVQLLPKRVELTNDDLFKRLEHALKIVKQTKAD